MFRHEQLTGMNLNLRSPTFSMLVAVVVWFYCLLLEAMARCSSGSNLWLLGGGKAVGTTSGRHEVVTSNRSVLVVSKEG